MSAESEHGLKSRIDSPLFFWREMPGEVPEAGHVDSTDVFDKSRVRTPSISISGRNEAGRALVEVGATNTTERGSRGSACTTTPYRGPYCSCPTPLGSRNAKMSPRRTQAFHDAGARAHFRPVVLVGLELVRF